MKKILIAPYGCDLRFLDAKKISEYFKRNNYKFVDKADNADLIIVFTCAALSSQANHSLNKIKELQQYDAELIIAGCLPVIEKEELSKIFNGKILNTKNLEEIDSLFPEHNYKFSYIDDQNFLFEKNQSEFSKIRNEAFSKLGFLNNIFFKLQQHIFKYLLGKDSSVFYLLNIFFGGRPYFLSIARGCHGNCSYCAIKKAVGPYKSKSLEKCVKEFEKGLKNNEKHIILVADDVGPYGLDVDSTLPDLLDKITNISGDYELLIRGLNPSWLVKYSDSLNKIVKRKKIKGMAIPIQSGSNRVLKLMQRYSDTSKMKQAFLDLKKSFKDLKLSTSFIIGFPTETMDDFNQTLSFVKEVDVDLGFIYKFSCRKGTEAEKINPKISDKEIDRRLKYAKKFLKRYGYKVIYLRNMHFYVFFKRN